MAYTLTRPEQSVVINSIKDKLRSSSGQNVIVPTAAVLKDVLNKYFSHDKIGKPWSEVHAFEISIYFLRSCRDSGCTDAQIAAFLRNSANDFSDLGFPGLKTNLQSIMDQPKAGRGDYIEAAADALTVAQKKANPQLGPQLDPQLVSQLDPQFSLNADELLRNSEALESAFKEANLQQDLERSDDDDVLDEVVNNRFNQWILIPVTTGKKGEATALNGLDGIEPLKQKRTTLGDAIRATGINDPSNPAHAALLKVDTIIQPGGRLEKLIPLKREAYQNYHSTDDFLSDIVDNIQEKNADIKKHEENSNKTFENLEALNEAEKEFLEFKRNFELEAEEITQKVTQAVNPKIARIRAIGTQLGGTTSEATAATVLETKRDSEVLKKLTEFRAKLKETEEAFKQKRTEMLAAQDLWVSIKNGCVGMVGSTPADLLNWKPQESEDLKKRFNGSLTIALTDTISQTLHFELIEKQAKSHLFPSASLSFDNPKRTANAGDVEATGGNYPSDLTSDYEGLKVKSVIKDSKTNATFEHNYTMTRDQFGNIRIKPDAANPLNTPEQIFAQVRNINIQFLAQSEKTGNNCMGVGLALEEAAAALLLLGQACKAAGLQVNGRHLIETAYANVTIRPEVMERAKAQYKDQIEQEVARLAKHYPIVAPTGPTVTPTDQGAKAGPTGSAPMDPDPPSVIQKIKPHKG